ncbi:MAG: hypothetical protein LJE62_00085 [Silicimonas sp.]|nr:hypothetical protein [Silicimonas sp.]
MRHDVEIRADQRHVIQSRGAFLAIEQGTERIVAVSENVHVFAGSHSHDELLGRPAIEWLGRRVIHALRNAETNPALNRRRLHLGQFEMAAGFCDLTAHATRGLLQVEVIPTVGDRVPGPYEVLKDVQFLTDEVTESDGSEQGLARLVSLFRTISAYHCIALDILTPTGFETVATAGRAELAEADCLASVQAHVVEDANLPTVGLSALSEDEWPDVSLSALSQPPNEMLESLRRVGAAASYSIGIFDGGILIGRLKFLHATPRLPNKRTELTLAHMAPLLGVELSRSDFLS